MLGSLSEFGAYRYRTLNMSRSLLYEGRGRQSNWPFILIGVNLVFVGLCTFGWSLASILVADALSWATWSQVGRSMPEFYEYPFMLLWALPLGGSCAAWMCHKVRMERVSFACAFLPISLFSTIIGWYNLAPVWWR